MIRSTDTTTHHAPFATALSPQREDTAVPVSATAHSVATTEAARPNRPPSPHGNVTRRRLAASYTNARREFSWKEIIAGYAVQPVAMDFLSVARAAPGGIHGRDSDGITLVEAAIREHISTTGDLLVQLRAIGADFTLADEEGNTLLHRLVMAQNLAAVERLLDCDVDVNVSNQHTLGTISRYATHPSAIHEAMQRPNWYWGQDDNASPLHLAAAFGDPALIRLLAERGASVDYRNRDRLTPLHWAVLFSDKPENVCAMLAAGASANGAAATRCPPLHSAAMASPCAEIIPILIESGADIDAKDENGQTAIHKAIFNVDNLNMLSTLLAHGANAHALDDNGVGAAELAIFSARTQTGAILTQLKNAGVDLALPDRDGNTMLHRAVLYGNETAVRALLENGVDANTMNHRTNPEVARYAKDPATAAQTLRHAHLDWDAHDTASPLHLIAAVGGTPSLVKALLEHGADINLRNAGGYTPLDWAALLSTSPDMVRALLEHGADITSTNNSLLQPVHAAAMYSRCPALVSALIEGGADVNARTAFYTTPLMHACLSYTEPEIVRTLLRHGANPTLANSSGETALHTAASMPHAEKVLALIEAGADVYAVDDEGNTPLSLAQKHNAQQPEIAQLLIDHITRRQAPARGVAPPQRRTSTDSARGASAPAAIPTGIPLSAAEPRRNAQMEADLMIMFADALDSFGANSDVAAELRRAAIDTTSPLPQALVQEVERWYGDNGRAAKSARAEAWHAIESEPHAGEFREFLAHLHETAEFRHPQQRAQYKQRIRQLLNAIQVNPPLRQQCFLIVEDATTSCGDRIGLTLNNLDMARIEHEAEHGQHSAQDLINIRTSQFRIQILNEVAQQKIAVLRPILGNRLDELEVMHGAITLVAEELKLIGVSRSMLYHTHAHFSDDDKRHALALIAQRECRGEYVKFIAQWLPWQKQLRRLRPNDFADLDQRVAAERENVIGQPAYTTDNDYLELCSRLENMQRERLALSLENWTREWLAQAERTTQSAN